MNTTNLILSLEDEYNSIDADFNAIETMDDNIDDGFQAMDELSKIGSIAEEAISNRNGMSLESMKITISAISNINSKLGLKTVDKGIVALESTVEEATDISRSKVALESVKDKMKLIWDSIMSVFKWIAQMIARLIDKIISFFSSSDTITNSFEDRIKAL